MIEVKMFVNGVEVKQHTVNRIKEAKRKKELWKKLYTTTSRKPTFDIINHSKKPKKIEP